MKKILYPPKVLIIGFLLVTLACSNTVPVDINNEEAVIKNIQGNWVGCVDIGNMYKHIKLSITDNSFKAWMQMSDYEDEPDWLKESVEKGWITPSSILKNTESNSKYRKFAFTCAGRCCGDKSIAIETLTKLVTYVDGQGLTLGDNVKMIRK
jgi:hypothetical protein